MITVLHVITGLRQGGAEQALARLVMRSDRARFRHIVAPLRDGGFWEEKLRAAGVDIRPLRLNSITDALPALGRLRRLIRAERPAIVQSWLYHADALAALAAPASHGAYLVWNLRNTDLGASGRGSWRALVAFLASQSRKPDLIISNSRAGLYAHVARGYKPRRSEIIPNGVDVSVFRPMPEARAAARQKLGLPEAACVVAMPARYEGFKDHGTFVEAARIACDRCFGGAFALAGEGVDARNTHLKSLIDSASLRDRIHILPPQDDMPTFYAAADVVTLSSSHGEGFPNVLAEAMACAVPVVATDVGDVRDLVGDAGAVVPPRDPQALADAWRAIADRTPEERRALGAAGRARVDARFTLERCIAAYESAYAALAALDKDGRRVGGSAA